MKGGLSDTQKRLIEWLEQNNHWFVTTEEIADFLSISKQEARRMGFTLSLKKWFITLKQNEYLLLQSLTKDQPAAIHPLVIGSHLIDPYYFSFSTAAAYHKLVPVNTKMVHIVTTTIRNNPDIHGISYRFIHVTPRKFFGYTPVSIDGQKVNMAEKEKIFVDGLEKFKYMGGLTEVIRLLKNNIQNLDVQRLVDYTVLMGSSTLIQRVGYVLDHFDVSFDEDFLKSYSLGVLTYLDPYSTSDMKPRRDEKWNLMINIPDSLFTEDP